MSREGKRTTVAVLCTAMHGVGGPNRHILNLYSNIDHDRYRLLIVYCSNERDIVDKFFLDRGVKKEDLFYFPTSKEALFIPLTLKLRRLFIAEDVDIVHTFFLHSDILGFFSAALAGGRYLISSVEGKFLLDEVHGVNKLKQACYAGINTIIRPYFYKTITVSTELKNELIRSHAVSADKIEVINVGIDIPPEEEINGDSCNNKAVKEKIVATASRFSKDKKLEYFLKAVPEVIKEVPQARFIVAGRGDEESGLKELAVKLDTQSVISFPGWIEDMKKFMRTIDVFVMTSVREGCPFTLLEALSFAKPVVAFDVPGIREIIINGENGILVEPFNLAKFISAIIKICKNPEDAKILGENGRRLVQSKFSLASEVKKIELLYDKTCQLCK